MKILPLLLLIPVLANTAYAKPKPACRAFYSFTEQDESTMSLEMVGFNDNQLSWLKKNDDKDICPIYPTKDGKRVPLSEVVDDRDNQALVGSLPVFVLKWERHRTEVHDGKGGHFAYPSNGILYKLDRANGNRMVPIGPIHDKSHTILSDTSVSLLKAALDEMKGNLP